MKKIIPLLLLLFSLASEIASAEINHEKNSYGIAINRQIQKWWENDSQSAILSSGSSCAVRILQIPGGEIVAVDVLPNCEFNDLGRSIAVEAIRRASPLPYRGFESSYERELTIVLRASNSEDRRLASERKRETEEIRRENAKSDAQWKAGAGASMKRILYSNECLGHLRWELHTLQLSDPSPVFITLKEDGRVRKVDAVADGVVDKYLIVALNSARPCQRVPSELLDSSGGIQLGPVILGSRIG